MRLMPTGWGEGWGLRPSPARRGWMDDQPNAYQCLPLVMANQWGWQVLCPTEVRVTWDGTPGPDGLRIEVEPQYTPAIKSQFGSGIVTFSPPWLFRTPPGWDLYLKGPSNRWKPNCHPLEGIIETWWLNYTFTINWKLIEPGTVVFARGESIGQLVPVPHATFEESTALEAPIGLLEPQAARELMEWYERRRQLIGQEVNVHHLYRKAEGVEDLRVGCRDRSTSGRSEMPAIESILTACWINCHLQYPPRRCGARLRRWGCPAIMLEQASSRLRFRGNDFKRFQGRGRSTMKGVQFLVDDEGNKTAVLIDLKKHARLWEDFRDLGWPAAARRSRGSRSNRSRSDCGG